MARISEKKKNNPLNVARRLRGMTLVELAKHMGKLPEDVRAYENDIRNLCGEDVWRAAETLDVSRAYLRGDAQRLAVYNYRLKETISCPIVSKKAISADGTFYLVEVEGLSRVIAVIICGDMQLTVGNWRGQQPTNVYDVYDYRWVNGSGVETAIPGGMPYIMP